MAASSDTWVCFNGEDKSSEGDGSKLIGAQSPGAHLASSSKGTTRVICT